VLQFLTSECHFCVSVVLAKSSFEKIVIVFFSIRSALKSQELKLKGIKAEIDGTKNEIISLQVRQKYRKPF
jgi:hypothetical protein